MEEDRVLKTACTRASGNKNNFWHISDFMQNAVAPFFKDYYRSTKTYRVFLVALNGLNCWLSLFLSEVTVPPPMHACSELAH